VRGASSDRRLYSTLRQPRSGLNSKSDGLSLSVVASPRNHLDWLSQPGRRKTAGLFAARIAK